LIVAGHQKIPRNSAVEIQEHKTSVFRLFICKNSVKWYNKDCPVDSKLLENKLNDYRKDLTFNFLWKCTIIKKIATVSKNTMNDRYFTILPILLQICKRSPMFHCLTTIHWSFIFSIDFFGIICY
jgi:hypothetical protein